MGTVLRIGYIGGSQSSIAPHRALGQKRGKVSAEDLRRITLWLDCNSDFFGSYRNTREQARGEIVQPSLE